MVHEVQGYYAEGKGEISYRNKERYPEIILEAKVKITMYN